jgi:hypothetical protein
MKINNCLYLYHNCSILFKYCNRQNKRTQLNFTIIKVILAFIKKNGTVVQVILTMLRYFLFWVMYFLNNRIFLSMKNKYFYLTLLLGFCLCNNSKANPTLTHLFTFNLVDENFISSVHHQQYTVDTSFKNRELQIKGFDKANYIITIDAPTKKFVSMYVSTGTIYIMYDVSFLETPLLAFTIQKKEWLNNKKITVLLKNTQSLDYAAIDFRKGNINADVHNRLVLEKEDLNSYSKVNFNGLAFTDISCAFSKNCTVEKIDPLFHPKISASTKKQLLTLNSQFRNQADKQMREQFGNDSISHFFKCIWVTIPNIDEKVLKDTEEQVGFTFNPKAKLARFLYLYYTSKSDAPFIVHQDVLLDQNVSLFLPYDGKKFTNAALTFLSKDSIVKTARQQFPKVSFNNFPRTGSLIYFEYRSKEDANRSNDPDRRPKWDRYREQKVSALYQNWQGGFIYTISDTRPAWYIYAFDAVTGNYLYSAEISQEEKN